MINFVENIDLIEDVHKYDVVLVGTNTHQTLGNGFQRKVRLLHKEAYKSLLSTPYAHRNLMGKTHSVQIQDTIFCFCFINYSYNSRPDISPDYLDYEALKNCLISVNQEYKGKTICLPYIGCSNFDGKGDKDTVLLMLETYLCNCDVYLYTYEQRSYQDEAKEEWFEIKSFKEKGDKKEYYQRIKKRKEKFNEQSKNRDYFKE